MVSKLRSWTPILAASIAVAAGTAACGGSSGNSSNSKGHSAKGGSVTFVSEQSGNPTYTPLVCGIESEAQKLGVTVHVTGPSSGQATDQATLVDTIAAQHPSMVILDSDDAEALIPPVDKLVQGGTTVVEVDSFTNGSGPKSRVGLNNVASGRQLALALAHTIGGKGVVLPLSYETGFTNLEQRLQGMKQGFAQFPGIKVLPEQFAHAEASTLASIISATKQKYPDLAGTIDDGSYTGELVAGLFRNPAVRGKTVAASFDVTPQMVAGVKDGSTPIILNANFFKQGTVALKAVVEAHEGKSVPKNVSIPTTVVTKANVNSPAVKQALSTKC